jgi:hypothetical protein
MTKVSLERTVCDILSPLFLVNQHRIRICLDAADAPAKDAIMQVFQVDRT